jgi:hypothetical protein
MHLVNPRGVNWRSLALAVACALAVPMLHPAPASAYVPPVDDLWARLTAGAPAIRSAIIDTETQVYEPSAPGADPAAPGTSAKPIPGREFRQRIYWQRGGWLAVETLAGDGTLLHLLLRDTYRTYSQVLAPKRVFTDADLRPVLYPFLEGSAHAWRAELTYWGIQPLGVDIVLYKSATAYVLGQGPGQGLWIDRTGDRPIRLECKVSGTAPLQIDIQFGDFMPVAPKDQDASNPRLPKVIAYEVNGRLFRRTTIMEVQADVAVRSFPLARWRQQLGLTSPAAAYALGSSDPVRP